MGCLKRIQGGRWTLGSTGPARGCRARTLTRAEGKTRPAAGGGTEKQRLGPGPGGGAGGSGLAAFSAPSPNSRDLELPPPAAIRAERSQPEPASPAEFDLGSESLGSDGRGRKRRPRASAPCSSGRGSAQRAAPASRAPHAPARLRPRHGRRQLLARRPPAPQPGRQHLAAAQHRSHPGIYQGRGDPRLLPDGSRRPKRKGAGTEAGRAGRLHQGARGRS